MKKTKITIDYSICGDGNDIDPRECGICLRECSPAVFLLHQTPGTEEPDPYNPEKWRVTPLWLSLCTRCYKCVDKCPVSAIKVK